MSNADAETNARDSAGKRDGDDRVVIKKYANRRLYNTASSSYVTLDHLAEMVREGVDFVVYDAKTNEDITRGVLAQIIFDEEARGQNLLPLQFLRQLIRFYGDSMQSFLPSYLELSLDSFTKRNDEMRQNFTAPLSGTAALDIYKAQVSQNMAMFDRAMKMFTPFTPPGTGGAEEAPAAPSGQAQSEPQASSGPDVLSEMRAQMEAMQRQIEALAAKK